MGGLIGAAVGFSNIPEKMSGAMLGCTTKGGSHPRPAFLIPKEAKLIEMVTNITGKAGEKVEIIDGIEGKTVPSTTSAAAKGKNEEQKKTFKK